MPPAHGVAQDRSASTMREEEHPEEGLAVGQREGSHWRSQESCRSPAAAQGPGASLLEGLEAPLVA